jgi:hypothetical protein
VRAAELKAVMYFCSMQRGWIEGIGDADDFADGEGIGIEKEVVADMI